MHCLRSILSLARNHHVRKNVPTQSILNIKHYIVQQPQCYLSQMIDTGMYSKQYIPKMKKWRPTNKNDQIVREISNGDADLEKKIRILMLEVEVMRQDGRHAPDNLKKDQWEHLLNLQSKNQRTSYLRYLFKVEKSKENTKAKKEARKLANPVIKPEELKENQDDLLYGIQHQSLFLRIRDQSINQFDNYRALQALTFGQPVVIDCSYENNMVYRETVNAAKQMTFVFGDNRIHKGPFNLHMCNVNMEGDFMKQLRKNIPSLDEPWFPMHMHTKSYLDIFPKEKLVYLTPHCREELTNFDHDAVYIIGCMVDKMNNEPLSLAKAKKDGIKMAKLPLERYLEWAPGSKKNLNINHMVPILLDLKLTNDWEFSLQHIPRRKLMETKIKAMEKKLERNPQLKKELMNTFRSKKNDLYGKKNNSFNYREKKLRNMTFKEKQTKSKRSLYDDENI